MDVNVSGWAVGRWMSIVKWVHQNDFRGASYSPSAGRFYSARRPPCESVMRRRTCPARCTACNRGRCGYVDVDDVAPGCCCAPRGPAGSRTTSAVVATAERQVVAELPGIRAGPGAHPGRRGPCRRAAHVHGPGRPWPRRHRRRGPGDSEPDEQPAPGRADRRPGLGRARPAVDLQDGLPVKQEPAGHAPAWRKHWTAPDRGAYELGAMARHLTFIVRGPGDSPELSST